LIILVELSESLLSLCFEFLVLYSILRLDEMVHRPADSRLLSNLLQQEKEYSKQLTQLLESSNSSLASFTAYAAASPPPMSHVIMSVAGSLAAVDEALKRYSQGVDQWRDSMRALKEAEEEVGNIMRDREILCVCCIHFFVSYISL